MYIVAIAWIYVVLMMSIVEALSTQGSVIGAVFTFLLYGVLPLSIVMYVLGAPMRRKARRAAEAAASVAVPPDGSHEAASAAVATERKEA
jgi:hypothetical protein